MARRHLSGRSRDRVYGPYCLKGASRIPGTTDATACASETHFCFVRDTPRVLEIADSFLIVAAGTWHLLK